MSIPSLPNQPPVPRKSGNRTVFVILAVIIGGMLLMCGGGIGGLFLIVRATNRVLQKEAKGFLEEINKNRIELEKPLLPAIIASHMAAEKFPAVVERLGGPLEPGDYHRIARDGWLKPEGEVVEYDVVGPKGSAVLRTMAVREGGVWQPTKVTVNFADGTVVDVPDPPRLPAGTNIDNMFKSPNENTTPK